MWEQDEPEATNLVLSGCLEAEVEALRDRMAEHDEDKRNSEASGSEWNDSEEGLPEATGAGLAGLVHR